MAFDLSWLNEPWILAGILTILIIGAVFIAPKYKHKLNITKGRMYFDELEGFTLGTNQIPFTEMKITRITKIKAPNGEEEEAYNCIAYMGGKTVTSFLWPSSALSPWVVFGDGKTHKNIRLIPEAHTKAIQDLAPYLAKIATLEADLREADKPIREVLVDRAEMMGKVKKEMGVPFVPSDDKKKKEARAFNEEESG